MTQYIIRRLLLMIPTFLGMTMLLSLFTRIVPGGPVELAVMEQQSMGGGDQGTPAGGFDGSHMQNSPLSEDQMQILKEHFGLDKPWIVAYVDWLWKFVRLDFGESFTYYIPVIDLIKERLPVSAFYGIVTFFISYLVCIPLGILKALKHKSHFDIITSFVTFVGFSVPSYVIAVVLMVFMGGYLQWFPLGGFIGDGVSLEENTLLEVVGSVIYHSILPFISYMAGSFAVLTYYVKSYLLEEISKDYVRTAVAKGVTYKSAVIKHALRNSIIPLASNFGQLLTIWMGGSMLVEQIFNIDGLALFQFNALLGRDYPVVIATFGIVAVISLLGTLVGDVAVAIIDPRVKYD